MNPKKKQPPMPSDNDGDEASSNPVAQTGTTQKTGSFAGKSNALGGGGRAAQLKANGMSGALIGFLGRRKYGSKAMSQMSAKGRARNASK